MVNGTVVLELGAVWFQSLVLPGTSRDSLDTPARYFVAWKIAFRPA
jgi:hypothetical protein